uniref:Uncharacterized protein n=1 Tax=Oryza punctata TaxID=4537 RepID=A0A0E0K0V1_ORYPU
MAGLGPYVDLVRQLDDGSFSFEVTNITLSNTTILHATNTQKFPLYASQEMEMICADAHITNAKAPKKVVDEV